MSAPQNIQRFTREQENLWKICTETFSALNSHLDRTLRAEANIKLTDFHILSALTDSEGGATAAVRMGELAQKTNVSPSRLTYQIEVLLRHNWVQKEPVKNDRRGKGILITDAGLDIYRKAALVYSREVCQTALDDLDMSLYLYISNFLQRVQGNIAEGSHLSQEAAA